MSKIVKGDLEVDGDIYAHNIKTVKPIGGAADSCILFFGSEEDTILNNQTVYLKFSTPPTSIEARAQRPLPYAGTLLNLYANVSTNTLDAAMTITARRNGAATPITVSVAAGTTGAFSDTANTQAFNAGDLLSVEANTVGSSAGSSTVQAGLEYQKGTGVS